MAQPEQVVRAAVVSNANTSRSRPAAALPSSVEYAFLPLISSSCCAEALGLDASRLVPEPNQRLGDRLHHRGRTADEYHGRRPGRKPRLVQHRWIDPSGVTAPALWRLLARKGMKTMTANRLAGSLSLAFSLILWCEPGSSCQLSPTW